VQIHGDLQARAFRTKLLLQVHDELLFDLYKPEESEARTIIERRMKHALNLKCPIAIELGVGPNWLEAH
jgi:DNA polymerase I